MRRKPHPIRNLFLVVAAALALVATVGAWRTFTVDGDEAVAQMDAPERDYLKRLGRLDRGMSREEVEAVLGPASSWTGLGADEEGAWLEVPGAPLARITVYIDHGAASRVRWMKMGHFTYRFDLPPRSELISED
ncbi:hypothetical protein [Pseudomarimonas salicorniae]|uniref:SmpA / OmlA family protein n=1 Tax=Pseudomarimonas salicorniae TaxID=2933270 RepID=A0ABT0GCP7_9GAMM|nr:hypothetical protein [Lysobacter sp. CAU 1642]MCK7592311.1 hypothetical protein [Lysobacter sp. CAU 1642]